MSNSKQVREELLKAAGWVKLPNGKWGHPDNVTVKAGDILLESEHYYAGVHYPWYGEAVHDCGCGEFESHEKAEVLQHIKQEKEKVAKWRIWP